MRLLWKGPGPLALRTNPMGAKDVYAPGDTFEVKDTGRAIYFLSYHAGRLVRAPEDAPVDTPEAQEAPAATDLPVHRTVIKQATVTKKAKKRRS